jgi:hypothetical protein
MEIVQNYRKPRRALIFFMLPHGSAAIKDAKLGKLLQ